MPELLRSQKREQMREKFRGLTPGRQSEVRRLARGLIKNSKSTQELNPTTEKEQSKHPD